MGSIWSDSCKIHLRESLKEDIEADIAIIGAGMAGILTAYLLKEKGVKNVVILEAKRIASGQTKNTTAKITSQHGIIYDILREKFSDKHAAQYADANEKAIKKYAEIIEKNNIDCDFEYKNAFVYTKGDADQIIKEIEAAKAAGIEASYVTETILPFKVTGAMKFTKQAQFNPLKFINKITEDLVIYENTPVKEIKKDIIYTDVNKVKAKNIVFATHFPFINAPGYYFMRMHQERSYVIALQNAGQLDGMYISADDSGYSFRNYKGFLLFGGENHRTGENTEGKRYDKLLAEAEKLYPKASEFTRWSAQDCMTLDCVPYIGRFSSNTENWYVATGFMKWGMTTSMAAAEIISDYICGKENENAEVFSPARFNTSSVPPLIDNGLEAVKGLAKGTFKIPGKVLAEIPLGHGGLVNMNGEKYGVYKEDTGKVHIVKTKCPHLGCQTEWNPDEKTWDCPCHGSRFDFDGKLIDNPAQENLD